MFTSFISASDFSHLQAVFSAVVKAAMDFHGVSCDYIATEYVAKVRHGYMENSQLVYLRGTVVELVEACKDEDMLDLLWKLLLECSAGET